MSGGCIDIFPSFHLYTNWQDVSLLIWGFSWGQQTESVPVVHR
jgi:hypothetical protein